ncbi:hypothetical protein ACH5RR_027094, partial [Cinchona calisaya]
ATSMIQNIVGPTPPHERPIHGFCVCPSLRIGLISASNKQIVIGSFLSQIFGNHNWHLTIYEDYCQVFNFDHNANKIEVQYVRKHATLTTAVDMKKSTNFVDISTTIGSQFLALGTEATYEVDSRAFTKYNVGINLTRPNFGASVILADKGDAIKATCYRHWDKEK